MALGEQFDQERAEMLDMPGRPIFPAGERSERQRLKPRIQ